MYYTPENQVGLTVQSVRGALGKLFQKGSLSTVPKDLAPSVLLDEVKVNFFVLLQGEQSYSAPAQK